MYYIVTGGKTKTDLFIFMYLGASCYIYVGQVVFGICWVIIEEREHFQIFRYIYILPQSLILYLVGRATAKTILATVAVLATLLFGVFFLHIPLTFQAINWFLLLVFMILGMIAIAAFGFLLSGFILLIARQSQVMTQGLAGLIYFLCGAVFPVEILPSWMHPISMSLPFTYWLEGMRRALLGRTLPVSLVDYTNAQLIGILGLSSFMLLTVSLICFRLCEKRAKKLGYIDRTTNY